jgi:diadenosine tetraphosphate (Ap4A) HIT family hydrolase
MSKASPAECYSCSQSLHSDLPIREDAWRAPGWRVALAFNSSLVGWTVVVPTRHAEPLDELSNEESVFLGGLLRDLSVALKEVTECLKTYVILLAEAEGFTHVHFHVIPRMDDLPEARRGTGILS